MKVTLDTAHQMEQDAARVVRNLAQKFGRAAAWKLDAVEALSGATPAQRGLVLGDLEENQLALLDELVRARSTAAGLGVGSAAGAGLGAAVAQATATAKRARTVPRYLVTDARDMRVFTPLGSRLLVTYAHGSHKAYKVGQELDVLVNDGVSDKRRMVKAHVIGIHSNVDVIFCATVEPIEAPDLDFSVRPGEPYLLLGCSNTSQSGRPVSVSHGNISTTLPDSNDRIRGDTAALPGESGGGVFSAETGKLIAINLAADTKHGNRAALLTVASLRMLLREHHMEEVRALKMPDFVLGGEEPTVAAGVGSDC